MPLPALSPYAQPDCPACEGRGRNVWERACVCLRRCSVCRARILWRDRDERSTTCAACRTAPNSVIPTEDT